MGLFLQGHGFPDYDLNTLRIPGVLQRMFVISQLLSLHCSAVCYCVGALAVVLLPRRRTCNPIPYTSENPSLAQVWCAFVLILFIRWSVSDFGQCYWVCLSLLFTWVYTTFFSFLDASRWYGLATIDLMIQIRPVNHKLQCCGLHWLPHTWYKSYVQVITWEQKIGL